METKPMPIENNNKANKRVDDSFYRELIVDKSIKLVRPSLSSAQASLEWLSDPEIGQYMGADFTGVSLDTEQKR